MYVKSNSENDIFCLVTRSFRFAVCMTMTVGMVYKTFVCRINQSRNKKEEAPGRNLCMAVSKRSHSGVGRWLICLNSCSLIDIPLVILISLHVAFVANNALNHGRGREKILFSYARQLTPQFSSAFEKHLFDEDDEDEDDDEGRFFLHSKALIDPINGQGRSCRYSR